MLRTALTPKWLVLHVVAVGLILGMLLLSLWQLDRARSQRANAEQDPSPVLLAELNEPGTTLRADTVGRQVTASGSYLPADQYLVAGKERNGRDGFWVLTPLLLDDRTVVPVVRGWVPDGDDPAATVPPGAVTVTGRLQPSEPTDTADLGSRLPDGQLRAVSTAQLVGLLPYDLHDGYLVLTAQTPPPAVAPAPVTAVGRAAATPGFPLQNAAYAVQWVVFAFFVGFLWWRMLRDDARVRAARHHVETDLPAPEMSVDVARKVP